MTQANPLRFGRLGPNTAHLCIDMQNLFAEDTPWHTPWMNRVVPVVVEVAERHARETIFTRFIPARHPDELPGSWRRYYRHWAELTLERIDKRLLDLVPPLARLPPSSASAFIRRLASRPCRRYCASAASTAWSLPAPRPMSACSRR